MEARRRAVVRDLAARDAAREWRREAARQLLSQQDCLRCAPKLAQHGMMLEARDRKERKQARRDEIRAAAQRVEDQALRRRGLR
jgi:hypothetical protein